MPGKIKSVISKICSERGIELIGIIRRSDEQSFIDTHGKLITETIIKYVTTLKYNCLLLSLDFYDGDSEDDIKAYLIAAIKVSSKEN